MIETVKVLERLFLLAEKAGLFTFEFRELLDDYLGDVQVVAEFRAGREEILAAFTALLANVNKGHPDAEIYLVAHSEGTVVSLLGLLQAIQEEDPKKQEWLHRIRGFMTLGSPIDKHLTLWPELFELSGKKGNSDATHPVVQLLRF